MDRLKDIENDVAGVTERVSSAYCLRSSAQKGNHHHRSLRTAVCLTCHSIATGDAGNDCRRRRRRSA